MLALWLAAEEKMVIEPWEFEEFVFFDNLSEPRRHLAASSRVTEKTCTNCW